MIDRKPIDAVLKDAVIIGNSIVGRIYADTTSRFKDGTMVKTSVIEARYSDVIYTKSSVYYVASWVSQQPLFTAA